MRCLLSSLVCEERPKFDLPGGSSAVKQGLLPWTPIDGVSKPTDGAEGIEPGLGPGAGRKHGLAAHTRPGQKSNGDDTTSHNNNDDWNKSNENAVIVSLHSLDANIVRTAPGRSAGCIMLRRG